MINIEETLKKLNIASLNTMQKRTMEKAGQGKDILLLSPTGSGKTLAFLLSILSKIDINSDTVQAVVITPGRELAQQECSVAKNIGQGLRPLALYGGRMTMEEHRMINNIKPQIVFCTPGKLDDHLNKGNINAYNIKFLVIDEFDKCMEMGFRNVMDSILHSLSEVEQVILSSATHTDEIWRYISKKRTSIIDYTTDRQNLDNKEDNDNISRVTLMVVNSPEKDKLETLSNFLRSKGEESTIVFLNYRDSVERTYKFLKEKGFSACYFHGGLEQKTREDQLYKFSNGSANILVSTDLASRGIDVPDVNNILHYHIPLHEAEFIHRTGRTARWKSNGNAFLLLGPEENLPEYLSDKKINEYLINVDSLPTPAQARNKTIYIGKGKKDKISKGDILGFICKIGGLASDDIGKIDVRDYYSYVAVSTGKVTGMLRNVKDMKIKGQKTIIEEIR